MGAAIDGPSTLSCTTNELRSDRILCTTVAEEHGGEHSFPSYSAAKRHLGSRPGQELHHIVEQSQAKPERSGFPVERVNTTDNFVWLPKEVHQQVSANYSRKDEDTHDLNSYRAASVI